MLTVRSRRVRDARALRRRATRDKRGQFLAEGPQAVREAITRPELLVEVFATPDAAERNADLLAASSGPVYVADDDSLAEIDSCIVVAPPTQQWKSKHIRVEVNRLVKIGNVDGGRKTLEVRRHVFSIANRRVTGPQLGQRLLIQTVPGEIRRVMSRLR